jgi:MatE
VWLASSLLVDSLAVAAQALIGQNATVNPKEALVVAQRALTLALRLGCMLGAGLLVTRTYIPHLFSADTAMYALAVQVLWWVALLQPVNALAFIWDGILYGVNGFKCASDHSPSLLAFQSDRCGMYILPLLHRNSLCRSTLKAWQVLEPYQSDTDSENLECCRYAAMMMPFNVAPAIYCISVAAHQETSVLALAWVWTGLALVMVRHFPPPFSFCVWLLYHPQPPTSHSLTISCVQALRALTIWLPFRLRANVFRVLPKSL